MTAAGVGYDDGLRALAPLAHAALDNTIALGPVTALTGPMARGDVTTISAHVAAVRSAPPDVAALYYAISSTLLDLVRRRGLEDTRLSALASALADARAGESHASASSPDRHPSREKASG
jgi:predicted short-subunit dehydrogenase-like oxidoreductase (DUF2520 family)